MRVALIASLTLLLGCPDAAEYVEPDSVGPWQYTGEGVGGERELELLIGGERQEMGPGDTWNVLTDAGPTERVDLVSGGREAHTWFDCRRHHETELYDLAWSRSDAPVPEVWSISIEGFDPRAPAAFGGVLIREVDGLPSKTNLGPRRFAVGRGSAVATVEVTEEAGAWTLTVWQHDAGGVLAFGELSGTGPADAATHRLTLSDERIRTVSAEEPDVPWFQYLSFSQPLAGGSFYSARYPWIGEETPGEVRLVSGLEVRATVSYWGDQTCDGMRSSELFAADVDAIRFGPLLEPPAMHPAAGAWLQDRAFSLEYPDEAESLAATVQAFAPNGDDPSFWRVRADPRCLPSAVHPPEGLIPAHGTTSIAQAWAYAGDRSSSCTVLTDFARY